MTNTCSHRHCWQIEGATPVFALVIEEWLGPTAGILTCDSCQHYALAHLLAWRGKQCEWRIYGVRAIDNPVVATYQANINRDYCDLSRKQSETEALFAAAAPEAQLMEYHVSNRKVTRVSASCYKTPSKHWQELTGEDFAKWSALIDG